MNYSMISAAVVIALLAAAPASAGPLPEGGVTYEQVVEILTKRDLPAKIAKDSKGEQIIRSKIGDVNFDVYFYKCANGACREIKFAANWLDSKVTQGQINQWNSTHRFLRVYYRPGAITYVEQDVIARHGSTENIEENLDLWSLLLVDYKKFMKI